MADEFEFKECFNETMDESIFSKKEFIRIPDTSVSGNYPSSQISWDMPALSNNDMYLSMKQSYLEIPLEVVIDSNTALGAVGKQAYYAGLKGSFANIINSINFTLDNNNLISFQELSNIPMHFKMLTQFSKEDELKMGDLVNFAKDTVESLNYSDVASVNGIGEYNNVIKPVAFAAATGYALTNDIDNSGLMRRLKKTSYDPDSDAVFTFANKAITTTKHKSFYEGISTTQLAYHIMCIIPLSFLTWDLFDQMPLTRGLMMKLTVTVHTGKVTYNMAVADNTITAIVPSMQYGVCPVMLTPEVTVAAATDYTPTLTIGIVKAGTVTSPFASCCYFVACMYKFTSTFEQKYLSEVPRKLVKYTDVFQNNYKNIAPSGDINWLITNGVAGIRGVLLATYLSASINGSTDVSGAYAAGNAAAYSPMSGPFSSAPNTCMKGTSWTNMNIRVGSTAVYSSNFQYTYDMYMSEMRQLGINGGSLIAGVNSGLITLSDFESGGYGFIYFDLSRKLNKNDDLARKSIEVIGRNNSLAIVDLYAWVFYEKEFTINTYTGKLES